MDFDFKSLRNLLPSCSRDEESAFSACLRRVPSSTWCNSRQRRCLDILVSISVLVASAIPMLLIACLVWATSPGPALFRQKRVGRGEKLFEVIKFRSMAQREHAGSGLTTERDSRVTPVGHFLRKFKLDELPQFYNVLKGDMSIVGPRPKLPQFAAIPKMPYRPGITGLASIAFRSEDQILSSVPVERVEHLYNERIKPLKANLDVCYMCHATPSSDARIVAATALGCVAPAALPHLLGYAPRPRGRHIKRRELRHRH
jgi:lipopolysaccharide/colanic/teichoic acid biosynthesis glycosyltransferase